MKKKVEKEEAAAEKNPDLKKPRKDGKTRVDKVKDTLTKAEGILRNLDKEGIWDPEMKGDMML